MANPLQSLIDKRKKAEAKVSRSVIDLTEAKWKAADKDTEASKLTYTDKGVDQVFRLSKLAFKQMANRIVGGLHTIALKNPPSLNDELFRVWLPLTDPKKRTVVVKHDSGFARGILGVEQADIDCSVVLTAIGNAVEHLKTQVVYVTGDQEEFPEWNWTRVVFTGKPINPSTKDEYYMMLDVRSSDYAVDWLVVDLGIVRAASGGAIIARTANKPYFYNQYKGVQGKELEAMAKAAAARFDEQLKNFEDILHRAEKQQLTDEQIQDLVKKLPQDRDTSKGLMLQVAGEIANQRPNTMMEVVNIIAASVQNEDVYKRRVQHEAFAGTLMGLEFLKTKA